METDKIPQTRKAFRQGELVFLPLTADEIGKFDPEGRKPSLFRWRRLGTNILREGELTGHSHEVRSLDRRAVALMALAIPSATGLAGMIPISNEDRLLVADGPVEVVHPEHNPLKLASGSYLVVVQREYDEVKARRVMD